MFIKSFRTLKLEYVFIGNTSHNKDDYLIAKVHGNCLLDIDYDVTPPDPLVDNTYIIGGGGTVTWNPTTFGGQTEIYARGEIHIESGTTLSINSGLIVHFADGTQMDLDTRLIVEPGAQLFVTGGAVLTSIDCPNAMWRGIEVWGDKDLPQNTINQGYVRLIGNATIENAYDGVRLWKPNDWTSMGGIVRATNAHFLNNWRDVEFIAYANINNLGVEQPNQSFFINTDFVTTDAYKLDDYIADHVTMYKVHGVKYLRCDFTDDRTAPTFAAQNKGIFSIDAGYKVLGTFSGATPTLSEYFDGTNWNECTFTNLETGIEALNANSQESITVDQSLFTDCRFGIRLNKVDNAFVTRNKYEVTGSAPLLYASNYGVLLQNCTGYQVEGNIINNDVIGGTGVLGISIDDSGLEDNDVYKNQFNNNHYATYSFDKNRNDAPANSPNIEGLEFLCNDHVDNLIVDELVYGFDPLDGEKVIQGSLPSPARNVFSDVSSGLDYHIAKYVDEDLYYIWNSANSNEEPSLVTPGVFTANINDPLASCPTNFTTVVPGPGKPLTPVVRAQLETDFGTVNDLHQLKIAEFDALQANGDRPELHQAVASLTPATKLQVKNLLLAEAPYLSRSLLEELADKAPGYFPNVWLKDIIIANIDLARERDFRDYLLTKSSPMPTGLYNQIESSLPSITERTEKQMEVVDLNKEKQQIANFILKDITQDSVGVDLAEYNEWVTKRGDIVCEFQIADKFLSRTLKDSCMNHLLKIDDQVSQMSASELKTELEDYSAFKKQMLVLTNDDGFLEGLDEVSEPIIRYYAENSIGTPQAQAQNLLCFFLGECDEAPPIPTLSGKLMAMYLNNSDAPSEFVKESMFEVYPNPNDGSFTIKSDSKGIVHVRDLSGRLVYEGILTDGSLNVDLRKLNAGVYLVQLIVRNEIIDVQKLIKR